MLTTLVTSFNDGSIVSNVPSDTPPSSRRKPIRSSIDVGAIAKAVNRVNGLHQEDKAFELPARLFEQVPFAIYICDQDGLVRRFNNRAAELWGRSPELGDPNERFCGVVPNVSPQWQSASAS
jgi:PAS domain-containing protein